MGIKLIIKNADFSENGIAPVATQIKGVKTSVDNQTVKLTIPDDLYTDANYRIKFAVTEALNKGEKLMWLGNTYSGRSDVLCSYTDGRMTFGINGKRLTSDTPFIPTQGEYNDVFVQTDKTILNGVEYQNNSGSAVSNISCNGKVTCFDNIRTGTVIIQEIEIYSANGQTLKAKYVAAKDSNNRACFWDILTDILCYANSGQLVAVEE